MPRKKKPPAASGGSPAWMTTFSDLMTLLLTFFILLFSFSTLDAIKFKNVASALQSVLLGEAKPTIFPNDIPPGNIPIMDPIPVPATDETETIDNELTILYEMVMKFVESENMQANITVSKDLRGVIIDINERVLFDSGKADLKPESKVVLEKVYELISQFENELIIEGHTDDNPINTAQFPSNWELSVIRAVNVLRYFTEVKNISPTRISAAGYGEYQPMEMDDTQVDKAFNRRVNILILVDSNKEDLNIG
ncbi:MAG: OmpA family protein [Clostridiales bacterium]|nr:OmpA family protein [Clostridiales bacterium]